MKSLPLILFLLTANLRAAEVRLAWDASPSPNVLYRLYAHTNSLAENNLSNAVVRVETGTNLTATLADLRGGTWYLVATARDTNGLESLPSNQLVLQVPEPPQNMRTLVLQYSATLTNWQDVGFFKLRIP